MLATLLNITLLNVHLGVSAFISVPGKPAWRHAPLVELVLSGKHPGRRHLEHGNTLRTDFFQRVR